MWSLIGVGGAFLLFGFILAIMPSGGLPTSNSFRMAATGMTRVADGNYNLVITSRETPLVVFGDPFPESSTYITFWVNNPSIIPTPASVQPGQVTTIIVPNIATAIGNTVLIVAEGQGMGQRSITVTFIALENDVRIGFPPSFGPGTHVNTMAHPIIAQVAESVYRGNPQSTYRIQPQLLKNNQVIPPQNIRWSSTLLSQAGSGVNLNLHNTNGVYIPLGLLNHVRDTNQPFRIRFMIAAEFAGKFYIDIFYLDILPG